MHMMTVKAIADGSGPDITGRTVPMPAGSYHLCREDDRTWFEQRSDVFELQPKDETESPVTATRDASGNVVGLSAGGETILSGQLASGAWAKTPSIFRLRITGTGTVTLDSKDSIGNIATAIASYTVSGATDQIEYPYPGDNAVAIRATLTGTTTAEII